MPEVEAHYRLHTSSSGNYHYDAWLVVDGERHGPYTHTASGCSISTQRWNLNYKSCLREAQRACKKLIREYDRQAGNSGLALEGVVRRDGSPSYQDLEATITRLEHELDIPKEGETP